MIELNILSETRMKILRILKERKELTVSELASLSELSQSALSQHLRHLRGAGMVSYVASGQVHTYSLVPNEECRNLGRELIHIFG